MCQEGRGSITLDGAHSAKNDEKERERKRARERARERPTKLHLHQTISAAMFPLSDEGKPHNTHHGPILDATCDLCLSVSAVRFTEGKKH